MENILEFLKGDLVQAIGLCVLLVIEFWLGKTSVVKSGSTLELVLSGIKKVLELVGFKKKNELS